MTEQGTPQQEPAVMQPYEAGFSTNLYLVHEKYGKQQFTFRGAYAHDYPYVMKQTKEFLEKMEESGWKPDVAQKAPMQNELPQPERQPDSIDTGSVYWRMKSGSLDMYKGKLHLVIPNGVAEPNEIACPIHTGMTMKRRTNDRGSWYSHKDGESWCTANPERE